jgi:hypothetical protein
VSAGCDVLINMNNEMRRDLPNIMFVTLHIRRMMIKPKASLVTGWTGAANRTTASRSVNATTHRSNICNKSKSRNYGHIYLNKNQGIDV